MVQEVRWTNDTVCIGGTGGRDTAGLGGKGGPYRLDAGHQVHQVIQANYLDLY